MITETKLVELVRKTEETPEQPLVVSPRSLGMSPTPEGMSDLEKPAPALPSIGEPEELEKIVRSSFEGKTPPSESREPSPGPNIDEGITDSQKALRALPSKVEPDEPKKTLKSLVDKKPATSSLSCKAPSGPPSAQSDEIQVSKVGELTDNENIMAMPQAVETSQLSSPTANIHKITETIDFVPDPTVLTEFIESMEGSSSLHSVHLSSKNFTDDSLIPAMFDSTTSLSHEDSIIYPIVDRPALQTSMSLPFSPLIPHAAEGFSLEIDKSIVSLDKSCRFIKSPSITDLTTSFIDSTHSTDNIDSLTIYEVSTTPLPPKSEDFRKEDSVQRKMKAKATIVKKPSATKYVSPTRTIRSDSSVEQTDRKSSTQLPHKSDVQTKLKPKYEKKAELPRRSLQPSRKTSDTPTKKVASTYSYSIHEIFGSRKAVSASKHSEKEDATKSSSSKPKPSSQQLQKYSSSISKVHTTEVKAFQGSARQISQSTVSRYSRIGMYSENQVAEKTRQSPVRKPDTSISSPKKMQRAKPVEQNLITKEIDNKYLLPSSRTSSPISSKFRYMQSTVSSEMKIAKHTEIQERKIEQSFELKTEQSRAHTPRPKSRQRSSTSFSEKEDQPSPLKVKPATVVTKVERQISHTSRESKTQYLPKHDDNKLQHRPSSIPRTIAKTKTPKTAEAKPKKFEIKEKKPQPSATTLPEQKRIKALSEKKPVKVLSKAEKSLENLSKMTSKPTQRKSISQTTHLQVLNVKTSKEQTVKRLPPPAGKPPNTNKIEMKQTKVAKEVRNARIQHIQSSEVSMRCQSALQYVSPDSDTTSTAANSQRDPAQCKEPSSLPSSPSRLQKHKSENGTKLITSEVFTRTIDSSKSIEVIYRQPLGTSELIRKANEYKYNDFDVSFIETTDSSLSDSIALPSSSSDHDFEFKRRRSISPASPKPTKRPLHLIEEKLRRTDAFLRAATIEDQDETLTCVHEVPTASSYMLNNCGPFVQYEQLPQPPPQVQPSLPSQPLPSDLAELSASSPTLHHRHTCTTLQYSIAQPEEIEHTVHVDDAYGDQFASEYTKEDYESVRNEAQTLVDSVLEQSIMIVSAQQCNDTYNSESEHYAITCDVNGIDMVKSPTIESLSGKSFDDNISVNEDSHIKMTPCTSTTILTTTNTTSTFLQPTTSSSLIVAKIDNRKDSNDNNGDEAIARDFEYDRIEIIPSSPVHEGLNDNANDNDNDNGYSNDDTGHVDDRKSINDSNDQTVDNDRVEKKFDRIERKFERLSSQLDDIDESANCFDQEFDNLLSREDISNLQSDFSKISWDESVSGTTAADVGLSTPDNDLQDLPTEPASQMIQTTTATTSSTTTDIDIPKPTPRARKSIVNEIAAEDEKITEQTTETTRDSVEKETKEKGETVVEGVVDFRQSKKFWESLESQSQSESQALPPIPKPGMQVKLADDSLDSQKDSSQGSKISSEQQVEYSETSSLRTSMNEDKFSREDDSEISDARIEDEVYPGTDLDKSDSKSAEGEKGKKARKTAGDTGDDTDDEDSEVGVKPQASFYIGESSSNIITKSTTDKRQDFAFDNKGYEEYSDDELDTEGKVKPKVQRAKSVDESKTTYVDQSKPKSDEIDDSQDGKPYVLSIDIPEPSQEPTSPSKLFRQDSETRNDILETSIEQDDAESRQIHPKVAEPKVINKAYEAQQIFFEDQIKPIAQEVVREEVISHTTTIVEDKQVTKLDELTLTKKLTQEKETHIKSTEVKDIISAQNDEPIIDTVVREKVEPKPKIETKLDLNLDKSELEPSEKSFTKAKGEEIPPSSSAEPKVILSPIKAFKGFTTYQETADGFKKTLLIDPSQVDQSMVDQTLDEVQESLEAVEEELIEVVKDGKLIKQSPSEFEFKLLPHIKYTTDPIQESHQEEADKAAAEEYPSISSTDDSSSRGEVVHRLKKEHQKDTLNRWSIPDLDHSSSGDSHYQSFEKTDSRPLSSDIENMVTYGNSSEYQTALDASLLPESTEYVSAVSSLSHSGKTISSHESMKSLDSESSANLGSMEVSEVSETLVPSITDPDLDREIQEQDEEDFDVDDSEVKLSTLEDKFCGVLMEDYPKTDDTAPFQMKRSHEMTFQSASQQEAVESAKPDSNLESLEREESHAWRFASSLEDKFLADEGKFASSLEEGSVLSMSLSSASAIDTVVENAEDLAGSYGASSLAGAEMLIRDDYTGTSFDEPSRTEQIDSMVMTSSVGKVDETNYANTQITTVTVSSTTTETSESETKRKGHKRSESTSISSTDFLKDLAKSASTDSPIEEEPLVEKPKSPVAAAATAAAPSDEKRESESESDYDIYESEYSRSFKAPTAQKKSKDKRVETFEKEQEPEKRPFTPSQSISEAILEDAAEEMETIRAEEPIRRPSQNMQDYSNIPNITVTEDLQKYSEEDDDEFQDNVLYKVQTQEDLDKKGDDTPIHYAHEQIYSIAEDQYQDLIERKYESTIADITTKCAQEEDDEKADSPDSFEMLEQPDISDEFVIIEEVAKEAHEMDPEGKSISIKPTKYVKKHDDEVEQILVKSAPAAPNAGSTLYRDDLNFEFEESPPMDQDKEGDMSDSAVASKRWVEMQLSDNAAHLRYPYEMERGILEDIKEEDAEFEIGSSRISSFKDSFSSTPEYDVLAGRKYFSRDHDNVSMSSLQEFESLEQAISLENRRAHQGSQDSLSNGSFTRRYMARSAGQGDDISLSSLKEFEGLENACLEAHLIEIKAKEEAALLSRSDESNKSSNGESKASGTTVTTVTTVTSTSQKTITERIPAKSQPDIEALLRAKLDECEDETSNIMEVSADSLELALKKPRSPTGNGNGKDDSQLGSCDSLEINKSGDIMTSSIDSFEISKDATARSSRSDVDSLEQQILQDVRRDSIDSIELEYALQVSKLERDSLEENVKPQSSSTTTTTTTIVQGPSQIVTRVITTTVSSGAQPSEMSKEYSNDSLNLNPTDSDQLISSTSSLDRTSSTATNATYQNENDSLMSGSMTSCGSNTMIDTLDSNFMDIYPGSSSSMTSSTTTTSQITICDEGTMHQQFHQQTQQHQQYIKDGEKRYDYFEIFEKDSDKENQRVKKAGESSQESQGPDEQKK